MTAVTPSPLPSSAIATNGSRNTVSQQAVAPRPKALSENAEVKRPSGPQQSSWKVEKRAQKTLQQSAFRREKNNLFSLYSYDPNDIESNLQATSSRTTEQRRREDSSAESIIPPNALSASSRQTSARAVFFSGRKGAFRSGGRKGAGRSGEGRGRRRRTYPGPRMPHQDLLGMKATEQQAKAYADAALG